MDLNLGIWAITIGALAILILMDFVIVSRKPHEVRFAEALGWSIFYIAVAIAFGIGVWLWQGSDFGTQYFTAYLVEKSLSVDNVFVFDEVTGEELGALLRAELEPDPNVESQSHGDPHGGPTERLLHGDGVRFAVENAQVEGEQGDDEGIERHPPHQRYFIHCFGA